MPDSYDGGTITAKFVWTQGGTSAQNVIWYIQARAFGNDETLDQAFGDPVSVTDGCSATAYQVHISDSSSAITIAGTPSGSKMVQFRVYRDGVADSLSQTAKLLMVMIEYGTSSYSD
jgi:hypothetical protein